MSPPAQAAARTSSYCGAAAGPPIPELLQELHVRVAVDELDELFVGRSVGVGTLVVLVHLLSALQLGQQRLVDVVWVTEQGHRRLQHWGGEDGTAGEGVAL